MSLEKIVSPPIAPKVEKELKVHGNTQIDNYFWMRLTDEQKEAKEKDEQTEQVLSYLRAENDYLHKKMVKVKPLQNRLYEEIVGRIKQDDRSVPYLLNGYTYYTRYEKGEDYPLYCRKKDMLSAKEEVMLNGPEMGKGKSYFSIDDYEVSENNELLAYSVDFISRREYTIFIKNLKTNEILKDKIEGTSGSITWANDNQTVFYTKKDPQTLRSYQVYKHKIGTDASQDVLVYEEKDEAFYCDVYKTKSRKYLMIHSLQTKSSEYRFLDANHPDGVWKVIQPRQVDLEYFVDHFGDYFYIITNDKAKNFRLMTTSVHRTERNYWKEFIAHRTDVLLESVEVFKDYLVINERQSGLNKLRIITWQTKAEHYIGFDDPTYAASIDVNVEFSSKLLRFNYTSLTTPHTIYDYDMRTREKKTMKQQQVIDDSFIPSNYISERIYAPSRDGKTTIPISIVYKKGLKKNGKSPLLLYGYGSYGYSLDPWFSSVRLSLLNRGFTFAIAHVRGGQDLGYYWYEEGKLLNKKNTFYDFIDCGQYLVEQMYTSSKHLYAQGGSAGGLLVGAVMNIEPELWHGIIAEVPFVDVISTMLDETIPLTTGEFDEWGNPKEETYYDYIKSYSPYDNVSSQNYPHLLAMTGYWDSQVQYWEPAKWVAKLREHKANDNLLLFQCNMDVGHGGASGRFQKYKEIALQYSFLLSLEGIE